MREMTLEQSVRATIKGVLMTECYSQCMDDMDDIEATASAVTEAVMEFIPEECDEPLHDDGCPRCSK